MLALADTTPNRISSHNLLDLDFSKRKTKAPPFLLAGSYHTGFTPSLNR